MQLKSLLQEWLSSNLVLMCKIRTYARYRDIVEKHLIPDLGESEADSLTSRTIGEYLASKRKHGNLKTGETLSASTVNMIRTVFKLVLQYACEHEYIRENPVLTTQRMRNKSVRVTAFTLQEQRLIEKAVSKSEDNRLIGVKISLYTGLRIGELLALRWGDIDFRSGMSYVSKTVYQAKNEENIWVTVIDRPKSDASVRYVPIPTMLLKELKAYSRNRCGETVICDKQGMPVKIRTYQELFKRLLRNNHLRELGFHSLRHTFATRALETKMDIKTLSELLGHESVAVTVKIYCHSLMSTKRKAINQLNKYYFIAPNKIFGATFLLEKD